MTRLLVVLLVVLAGVGGAPARPAPLLAQNGSMGWVSNMYDAHSPARPPNCDEVCVSKLRMARIAQASRAAHIDYWPYGQVTTGYIRRGAASEYYVELGAGNPGNAQATLLILDSASHYSWMQCKPCQACYPQAFPVFDPYASSTYTPQAPGSPFCNVIQSTPYGAGTDGGVCRYQVGYEDGTETTGQVTFDNIHFWDAQNPGNAIAYPMPFGCGFSNSVDTPTSSSGVLALADQMGLSWPEQWNTGWNYNPSFSFCFASIFSPPNSGWVLFGDGSVVPTQGKAYYTTPIVRVNGLTTPGWTYVDVVDFVVGTQAVGIPNGVLGLDPTSGSGGTLVDCGTMVSEMVENAYDPLRDAWENAVFPVLGSPDPSESPGPPGFDTCWDYPNDVQLPDLGFLFSNNQIFYLGQNAKTLVYYSNSNNRRMCFPFQAKIADQGPAMLWGSLNMHNIRMVFDRPNNLLGWQNDVC